MSAARLEALKALAQSDHAFQFDEQHQGRLREYQKRMRRYMKAWVDFMDFAGVAVPDPQRPFETPPSTNQICAFLEYHALTRTGFLGPKLSIRTIQKLFTEIRLEVTRQSLFKYPVAQIRVVEDWIKQVLKDKVGLSTHARPKALADRPVVVDVLRFLWICDEKQYYHPRLRVQYTLAILLIHYLGFRPGEIVESSSHYDSNEGLKWGDIKFKMIPDETGQRLFCVHILMRNRKGRRDLREKDTTEVLTEEPDNRATDPVAILFALAIADKALLDIRSPADLERLRFCSGSPEVQIAVREGKRSLPILRRTDWIKKFDMSEDKMVRGGDLTADLMHIGHRAGYADQLTAYSLRRGHANQIERFLTPAQRRRQMGHQNDNTFQHYISTTSGVHIQAVMQDRPQNRALLDFHRSMRTSLNTSAPSEMQNLLAQNRWEHKTPIDSTSFLKHRADWEEKRDKFSGGVTGVPVTAPITRPGPSRHLQVLFRYDKARHRIVELFYHEDSDKSTPFMEAVSALVRAATRAAWAYPGTTPDENTPASELTVTNRRLLQDAQKAAWSQHQLSLWRKVPEFCLWGCCRQILPKADHVACALHMFNHTKGRATRCKWDRCGMEFTSNVLLRGHMREAHGLHTSNKQEGTADFCFECREYFPEREQWQSHCQQHLSNPDTFIGQIRLRGMLIVAPRCPFCLGNMSLPPQTRAFQYKDVRHLRGHIKTHLQRDCRWPMACPHPTCQDSIGNQRQFWTHLTDTHGLRKGDIGPGYGEDDEREEEEDEEEEAGKSHVSTRPDSRLESGTDDIAPRKQQETRDPDQGSTSEYDSDDRKDEEVTDVGNTEDAEVGYFALLADMIAYETKSAQDDNTYE